VYAMLLLCAVEPEIDLCFAAIAAESVVSRPVSGIFLFHMPSIVQS